jgi:F-type H+-transporting ATPase subunit delta
MKLSPITYANAYLSAARKTTATKLPELANKFWQVVWKHRHLSWKRRILLEVERLWHEQEEKVVVEVSTAKPLSDTARAHIKRQLKSSLNKDIELKEIIKPHLLSGIIITLNNRRYDASLKGRLDSLYQKLAGNINFENN